MVMVLMRFVIMSLDKLTFVIIPFVKVTFDIITLFG
jgi:hypothetical protein